MRKTLNENPMVQMAVLAVVGVALVFMLFTTVLKKDPAPPAAPTDPAAAAAAAPAGTDSTTPAADPAAPTTGTDPAATAPVVPSTPITPSTSGVPADAAGLLPSKGLPKDVLVAYAKNQAIALLVIDPKGLSDKKVKLFTEPLRARKDVTVFVVDAKDVADYYRITAGVSVDRVPALVVIRPRKLTHDAPTATVSYGFRGPESVDQAVDDALYDGKPVTSYP